MAVRGGRRALLYESVLEHIRADLQSGALHAGDRMPSVAELAEKLRVGQAAVREAYRVLELMGVLEVRQGRGTRVASSPTDYEEHPHRDAPARREAMADLLEARILLEPSVAGLAAERATPAEADAILRVALEMEGLYHDGRNFFEPDVRFHELLFEATHNPVMSRILRSLRDLLRDSRYLTSQFPNATEKAIHYHKLIALAVMDADAAVARKLMLQHVEDVERSFRMHYPALARSQKEGGELSPQS